MNTSFRIAARLASLFAIAAVSGCLSDSDTGLTVSAPTPPPGGSNSAPNITGNPPSAVLIAEPYSFTPQATDPDGDSLTFSIQNKPAWASFDSSTGRISGTPTLGDVGSYSDIRLSVSDGQLSATMSAFSVDVTQVATASTTLTWSAPTQNNDGSALTNLAGYKIYYGQSSGDYTNQINIDNPSITTYVVDNLSPATYYFAATAYNSDGFESAFSTEAVKMLN